MDAPTLVNFESEHSLPNGDRQTPDASLFPKMTYGAHHNGQEGVVVQPRMNIQDGVKHPVVVANAVRWYSQSDTFRRW